jgi:hypothetical protein
MASGTSIFNGWLESLGQATAGRDLRVALDVVSSQVAETFGARIWFAQILGRRWSYIAGLKSERPSRHQAAQIRLSAGIGLVAESWGEMSPKEQGRLQAFLERLVDIGCSLVRWG